MKNGNGNVWIDRFDTALRDDELVKRITVAGRPATGLHELAPAHAAEELRRRMEAIFIPDDQAIRLIRRVLGVARGHAEHYYPDRQSYLRGINGARPPLSEAPVICVSGLAGTGKSEIAKAMRRFFQDGPTADPGSGYQPVSLESGWHVSVENATSLKSLLEQPVRGRLYGLRSFNSDAALREMASRLAFRHGASFLIADELQFGSLSTTANASITRLLYQLWYIGLPLVFIGNFSLLHRLMKRPPEDRHRLLSDPIVILPDTPDNPSVGALYEQYRLVSEGALCSAPSMHVEQIEHYCAGIKRNRKKLLILAYRIVRENGRDEVTGSDLEAAYLSCEFTIFRNEATILRTQDASKRKVRDDLWCPLELPLSTRERSAKRALEVEAEQIGLQALIGSLSSDERRAYVALAGEKDTSVSKLGSRGTKRPPITTEALLSGTRQYLDSLSAPTKNVERRPIK